MSFGRSTHVVVCAGALAIAAGCSNSYELEETSAPPEPAATQGAETASVTSRADEGPRGTAAAKVFEDKSAQGEDLSHAEIVGIVDVVNSGEIEQALIAQRRANAPQIREYAERVIADHRKAKQATAELAEREGVVPVGSAVATDVSEQAAGVLESLQNRMSSERFDRMYIETQLRQHRNVIGLLDGKLLPSARGGDRLETELLRMRAMVDRHLTQARNIELTL